MEDNYYTSYLNVLDRAFYAFVRELEKVNTPFRNQIKYFKKLYVNYKRSTTPEERQRRLDKLCRELNKLKLRKSNENWLNLPYYERQLIISELKKRFSRDIDVERIIEQVIHNRNDDVNICDVLYYLVTDYDRMWSNYETFKQEDRSDKQQQINEERLTDAPNKAPSLPNRTNWVRKNSINSNNRSGKFLVSFDGKDELLPIEKIIKRAIAEERTSISADELKPYNLNVEEEKIIDNIVHLNFLLRLSKSDKIIRKDVFENHYYVELLQQLLQYSCRFNAGLTENSNKKVMANVLFHFNPLMIMKQCKKQFGESFSADALKAANEELKADVLQITNHRMSRCPRHELSSLTYLMTLEEIQSLYHGAKNKNFTSYLSTNASQAERENVLTWLQIEFANAIKSNPNYHSPFKKSAKEELKEIELAIICVKHLKVIPEFIVNLSDLNNVYEVILENVVNKKEARKLIAYIEVARSGKVEEIDKIKNNTDAKKR